MYKHSCGAVALSVIGAFVHLLDCPLIERPAPRDPAVERVIGRRRGQLVERVDIDTRIVRR